MDLSLENNHELHWISFVLYILNSENEYKAFQHNKYCYKGHDQARCRKGDLCSCLESTPLSFNALCIF